MIVELTNVLNQYGKDIAMYSVLSISVFSVLMYIKKPYLNKNDIKYFTVTKYKQQANRHKETYYSKRASKSVAGGI